MFCLGDWQQLGSFQANSSGHQYPCVNIAEGCLQSVSTFTSCKLQFVGRKLTTQATSFLAPGAWVYRGRWTQNGTVEIRAIHVAVAVVLAEWIQNAPVTLSVIADEPPTSLLGCTPWLAFQ